MTKIITRYFGTREQALKAWHELVQRQQVSPKIMRLYDKADGLAETLTAAKVAPDTAKAYQDHVAKGGAVLLVAAGFKPLGVAKTTRTVTAQMGATQLEGLVEEVEVEDRLRAHLSILPDHDLMLSKHKDPYSTNFHMANWPIPLISRRKPFTGSIIGRHARMADFILPLVIRRSEGDTAYGSKVFSFSRMLGWPTLIKR